MAFGNGELMQVPWETVIKSYRRKLGDKSFPRLEDYANGLLQFAGCPESMFPRAQQDRFFDYSVGSFFQNVILASVNELVGAEIKSYR